MSLKDALIFAAPLLTLALLYCGWRAAHLLLYWRPAAATVIDSDYSELQQSDDFWHFGMTLGTIRGWNWRDGKNGRLIHDQIIFETPDGERQHASVERRVRRGWHPSAAYTVWYDPADPSKATGFGPGYWLMLAALWGFGLASVFNLCMHLRG